MKKGFLFLLVALVVASLSFGAIGGDLSFVIPSKDMDSQSIESLITVGVKYKVTTSTDPIKIADPPVLIYLTKVASDGTGTDWVKIISTYTTASVTDALTIDEVQTTTSQHIPYYDVPIYVGTDKNYCYIIVNDTNTYGAVHYLTK